MLIDNPGTVVFLYFPHSAHNHAPSCQIQDRIIPLQLHHIILDTYLVQSNHQHLQIQYNRQMRICNPILRVVPPCLTFSSYITTITHSYSFNNILSVEVSLTNITSSLSIPIVCFVTDSIHRSIHCCTLQQRRTILISAILFSQIIRRYI